MIKYAASFIIGLKAWLCSAELLLFALMFVPVLWNVSDLWLYCKILKNFFSWSCQII